MAHLHYIDLFAGAGGLSEGFIENGFKPLAHVEADTSASFTLRTRVAYHYLRAQGLEAEYRRYIRGEIDRETLYRKVPESELASVINEKIGEQNAGIFRRIDDLICNKKIDLIIGGPPCQAYSVVGRAPLKHRADDERTKLYVQYGRFLQKYKPTAFVFENVPGILSAGGGVYFQNLKKYYRRLGYRVEARLLNARDFDVIQNRLRVIIIGWQKDLNWSYPEFEPSKFTYARDDIFSDLPPVAPGESTRVQHYACEPSDYLARTAMRNGVDHVSQHITRPHNERDLDIYRLAIAQMNNGTRLRNSDIPPSMRTQKNVTSFLDRFKVVGPTPHTVIAHIAKDGHHYIHPDASQLRSISVREAARIQSFPDNFYFEGSREQANRSSAFRQIGNAVPPLMARKLASRMKEMLIDAI